MAGMDIGMIKNMLSMMGASLPSAMEPTNPVAEFVDREVATLMPDDADVVDLFKGVYVGAANADPNKVLGVLIRVHNDIGDLVKELQEVQSAEESEPEEIDEESEDESESVAFIDVGDTKKAEE